MPFPLTLLSQMNSSVDSGYHCPAFSSRVCVFSLHPRLARLACSRHDSDSLGGQVEFLATTLSLPFSAIQWRAQKLVCHHS